MISDRNKIDDEFAGMSTDVEYQKNALLICEEFSAADFEALKIRERETHV